MFFLFTLRKLYNINQVIHNALISVAYVYRLYVARAAQNTRENIRGSRRRREGAQSCLSKSQNDLKMYRFLRGGRQNTQVRRAHTHTVTHTHTRQQNKEYHHSPLSPKFAAGHCTALLGHKSDFHLQSADGLGNRASINHPRINKGKCLPRAGKVRGVTGRLTAHLMLDGTEVRASHREQITYSSTLMSHPARQVGEQGGGGGGSY